MLEAMPLGHVNRGAEPGSGQSRKASILRLAVVVSRPNERLTDHLVRIPIGISLEDLARVEEDGLARFPPVTLRAFCAPNPEDRIEDESKAFLMRISNSARLTLPGLTETL